MMALRWKARLIRSATSLGMGCEVRTMLSVTPRTPVYASDGVHRRPALEVMTNFAGQGDPTVGDRPRPPIREARACPCPEQPRRQQAMSASATASPTMPTIS